MKKAKRKKMKALRSGVWFERHAWILLYDAYMPAWQEPFVMPAWYHTRRDAIWNRDRQGWSGYRPVRVRMSEVTKP